jgi:hypothetical protein
MSVYDDNELLMDMLAIQEAWDAVDEAIMQNNHPINRAASQIARGAKKQAMARELSKYGIAPGKSMDELGRGNAMVKKGVQKGTSALAARKAWQDEIDRYAFGKKKKK